MLPIAASLSEQGIAIGTVLAFVVGGAGVSIPNVILLSKLFKRRLLIVYATTVVAIGVVVGVVFNIFLVCAILLASHRSSLPIIPRQHRFRRPDGPDSSARNRLCIRSSLFGAIRERRLRQR